MDFIVFVLGVLFITECEGSNYFKWLSTKEVFYFLDRRELLRAMNGF